MRSAGHRAWVHRWAAERPAAQRTPSVQTVEVRAAAALPGLRQAPWMVAQQRERFMTPAEAKAFADEET